MADEQTLTPEAQAQAALDARAGQSVPPVPISAPVVGSNPTGQTLGSAALASAPALYPTPVPGAMLANTANSLLYTPLPPPGPPGAMLASALGATPAASSPIQPLPPPNQELVNQKANIVSGPKTAAQTSVALNSPSPVSLNKRQEELMKSEAENQAPVAQAHYDLADELNRTRTVADEVTKQKNQMLTDHSETMAGILANQQMHADMAKRSADDVASDIKSQISGIQPIISNPGVFTKTSSFDKSDLAKGNESQIPLKILGAIGQAVAMAGGAYGAGITHSRNFAMDIINDQIARNIAAQKENNEAKWQKINVTHQLGNDQQLKYAHMLEQDNRNELSERFKVQDYLSYLGEKTANQDTKTKIASLQADNASKIADVQNNMAMQRKNFLDANVNQQVAQAAHAQSIAREEAHRLEDRHDKYVEHAMSKAGGEMGPDEAEARWTAQTTGNPYVKDPKAPQTTRQETAVTDTYGNVRNAISPEAQKATEPLMRAVRAARADWEAYKADPSSENKARLVLTIGQVDGLKRAPGTPHSIGQSIKEMAGFSTGNAIADSIPDRADMAFGSKNRKDFEKALNRHAESIEESAFGTPKIPYPKVQ
jgi:hypothetical protein